MKSNNQTFIDPRLQAKERYFQQLHLATFETMGYMQAVMQAVSMTGQDVSAAHEDVAQLRRDYEVTEKLAPCQQAPYAQLCQNTRDMLLRDDVAQATKAQLCAAATITLNHLRIMHEIPDDLLDIEQVTGELKANMLQHQQAWERILGE